MSTRSLNTTKSFLIVSAASLTMVNICNCILQKEVVTIYINCRYRNHNLFFRPYTNTPSPHP
ncbi:hypothetical protein PBCV1_A574aL [Paramecium bursaria Chlorella virus 1]|uniref:Uncharacterized protein n=1 Tax=Paramecium bursaria Chlorella virus 1 TaxID=10506 RepID=F8TU61_PBCV1|nr:hypothetical protein PBCV1_A574aL [Paramecium bursaria Chlorella virus 1]AEI70122.1 hypothetical protein [Paramecium bursaria Chlorella virus 1]